MYDNPISSNPRKEKPGSKSKLSKKSNVQKKDMSVPGTKDKKVHQQPSPRRTRGGVVAKSSEKTIEPKAVEVKKVAPAKPKSKEKIVA